MPPKRMVACSLVNGKRKYQDIDIKTVKPPLQCNQPLHHWSVRSVFKNSKQTSSTSLCQSLRDLLPNVQISEGEVDHVAEGGSVAVSAATAKGASYKLFRATFRAKKDGSGKSLENHILACWLLCCSLCFLSTKRGVLLSCTVKSQFGQLFNDLFFFSS